MLGANDPAGVRGRDTHTGIIAVGRNAWRTEPARRVAFLVDGAAYYAALSAALARAERQILVLGWDIDSRALLPDPDGGGTVALVDLLHRLVSVRPELRVHILAWDFSSIYLLERELLTSVTFGWRGDARIDFRLDEAHSVGASHHQKVVVIDDAVAFCGGLDITTRRWDTPAHRPDDDRRLGPDGKLYAPFHDVQAAVDGQAAAALGELARDRWLRATGERLPAPSPGADAWPPALAPEIEDVAVSVVRTEPAARRRAPVREVQALFLDTIAAARRSLYIENQYVAAPFLAHAIAERLEEAEGPDVVIVIPSCCSGWLEESTLGRLRGRFLRTIEAADRHGRLRVMTPRALDGTGVYVHSKVTVVDDRLVRVGSSNLSNRSMAVDTECDIAIESLGDARLAAAIAGLRDRLLGEHLGVAPDVVAEAVHATGSLSKAIDALRGGRRTLTPISTEAGLELAPTVAAIADPEEPLDADRLFDVFLPEEHRPRSRAPLFVSAAVLAAMLGLAAAWRFGPLGEWVSPGEVAAWLSIVAHSPLAPLAVMAAFIVLGICMVPLNVLLLASGMAFGPGVGLLFGLLGTLSSASASYAAGRGLGNRLLRRLASPRIARLGRSFARRGFFAVLAVRLVPVAPFTVVNLIAGASRVSATAFLAGTLAGTLPGAIVLTLVGRQLLAMLRARTPAELLVPAAIAASALVAILLLGHFVWRRIERRVGGAPLAAARGRRSATRRPLPGDRR